MKQFYFRRGVASLMALLALSLLSLRALADEGTVPPAPPAAASGSSSSDPAPAPAPVPGVRCRLYAGVPGCSAAAAAYSPLPERLERIGLGELLKAQP